jgi:hypothetical protein
MKRFFGIFAFIARTPGLARLFRILGKAAYWTAFLFSGPFLLRLWNDERIDFALAQRWTVPTLVFFIGFMVGAYRGNSPFFAANTLQSRDSQGDTISWVEAIRSRLASRRRQRMPPVPKRHG